MFDDVIKKTEYKAPEDKICIHLNLTGDLLKLLRKEKRRGFSTNATIIKQALKEYLEKKRGECIKEFGEKFYENS